MLNLKQLKEKTNIKKKKKRIYWKQSLKSNTTNNTKNVKIKKSLKYVFLLKKFSQKIEYKNIKLLKAFLTKFGKIKARRKTRIKVKQQRKIAKSIRRARAVGLLPFNCNIKF